MSKNTAVGKGELAGGSNISVVGNNFTILGSNNTALGSEVNTGTNSDNSVVIGYNSSINPNSANSVVIGSSSVSNNRGVVVLGASGTSTTNNEFTISLLDNLNNGNVFRTNFDVGVGSSTGAQEYLQIEINGVTKNVPLGEVGSGGGISFNGLSGCTGVSPYYDQLIIQPTGSTEPCAITPNQLLQYTINDLPTGGSINPTGDYLVVNQLNSQLIRATPKELLLSIFDEYSPVFIKASDNISFDIVTPSSGSIIENGNYSIDPFCDSGHIIQESSGRFRYIGSPSGSGSDYTCLMIKFESSVESNEVSNTEFGIESYSINPSYTSNEKITQNCGTGTHINVNTILPVQLGDYISPYVKGTSTYTFNNTRFMISDISKKN